MQKGLLRNICLWLYMIQTGGIKLMWTCNSNKKPSPDKRSNSNTEMKNLKGNCTHEHKVPKKANLITLQAYQSYKYQKTKHKKLIQHLHIHWKACLVTMDFSQSQGR